VERREYEREPHNHSTRHGDREDAREDTSPEISFLKTEIFQGLTQHHFTIQKRNYQEEDDAHDEFLKHRTESIALGEKYEKSQRKKHQHPRDNEPPIHREYFEHTKITTSLNYFL